MVLGEERGHRRARSRPGLAHDERVHLQSRVLSPAAEAFRYFVIEHGEAFLLAHDAPLLSAAAP